MKTAMRWGVQVADDKRNQIVVFTSVSKRDAIYKALELGGKLVRVRTLS